VSITAEEKARTNLLFAASIHHLRLTLEEIPIGTIAVTDQGIIESIDEWTEHQLEFDASSVRGSSIDMIFANNTQHILQLMRERIYGLVGEFALCTQAGKYLPPAKLAMMPGLDSHRFVFSLIYTNA